MIVHDSSRNHDTSKNAISKASLMNWLVKASESARVKSDSPGLRKREAFIVRVLVGSDMATVTKLHKSYI